jgi:hypothetical protein
MSAWLSALLGRILDGGTIIPLGYGLNFNTGVRARLNLSTKFVDIDLRDAAIQPSHLAASSNGVAAVFVLRVPMTAGTPGTADDVTGPAAPVDLRILDRWVDVTTAIGGSSVRFRDTAGGSGDALSGTLSSAAVDEGVRATGGTGSAQSTLAAGDIVYVRRTDRGVAGTAYLLCERA